MSKILSGTAIRDKRATALRERISRFSAQPKLAIIQVGDNPESAIYIRQKIAFGESIGCAVEHIHFPTSAGEAEIVVKIGMLNADPAVHGIIVQIPMPENIPAPFVIDAIDPRKDVDGLSAASVRALAHNLPGFVPATTRGILTLLDEYGISVAGKKVVVVGRSALVGKPTALALLNRDATVTVCHSKTERLSQETKSAVVIVVAAGKPGLITAEHVSEGQTVIDVGINLATGEKLEEEVPKRRLVGDVDFDAVEGIVAAITPVPGGVGPMTVLSLFENLADAFEKNH